MKKFLAIVLGALSFAAVGCAKDNDVSSSENGSGLEPQTSEYTVLAEYDYGLHVLNTPTMLYSGATRFFDLPENYGTVVAGDVFVIEYTGEARRNDCYPGEVSILGEIVCVSAQKAKTVCLIRQVDKSDSVAYFLYDNGSVGEEVSIKSVPQCYLTKEGGEIGYAALSDLDGDTVFYGTYSAVDGYNETDGYTLSGLYSWNVRGE